MERKKKTRGQNPAHPDAEVLKSARELPQTMKSRFQLNLMPETIEESLIYCLNSLGCERGEYLIDTTEYHNTLINISSTLTSNNWKCGLLFTGSFGTGKTTLMLALRKFFDLLKGFPSAWSYQEIESLESAYLRAEDFRYPIVSHEKFLEAVSVPILFLDNLGLEFSTPRDGLAVELIKNLIRLRYDMRLFTLIATPFDGGSIRETYGNHILSILNDGYSILELDWPSFRNQRVYEKA